MEKLKNYFNDFAQLTRLYSIPASLASLCVVLSYAHYSLYFSWFKFVLLTISICFIQMGANLFDDFIDIKSEIKKGVSLENIKFNSFVPKAELILNKKYSFDIVKKIIAILFIIPTLIGLYFTYTTGWEILIYIFIGGILTIFYPISARYYLSEIIIGLIYGPLVITGGYYVLTHEFNSDLLILSIAIFFSTLILLHIHSLMDWEFDIKSNKKTLCILSGSKENAITTTKAMIIIAYGIIVVGVLNLNFNPHMLYVFLTLPIATKLINSIKDYINIKDTKFIPRWYYGPFENWNKIKESNTEFFMYRFYLGRNFALLFAIFASIGAIV